MRFFWPIGPVLFVAKDHVYKIECNTLKRFFSQGQSRKTAVVPDTSCSVRKVSKISKNMKKHEEMLHFID